jgi:hypothetical protein
MRLPLSLSTRHWLHGPGSSLANEDRDERLQRRELQW